MAQTRRPSHAPELEAKRAIVLFWRALTLRCPNCGSRGIFQSWFKLRDRCPRCGLRLERGESDHFVGAYLFNLIAVEILLGALILGVLLATWPDPPWTALQYGGVALMAIGAFVCYPFAKTTWLAFDIMLRPVTREELEKGQAAE